MKFGENKWNFCKGREDFKNELLICIILYDKLGLTEKSESNRLKVLHYKFVYDGNE